MNYTLNNKHLSITIKDLGAELCSVKAPDATEYIWQANDRYWNRHAPVLFPIVGKLKDNFFTTGKKEYILGQHGFARDMKFDLTDKKQNELVFKLCSNQQTYKNYPFLFTLFISYTLTEKKINVKWKVINEDEKTLFFSIGGHPAFNTPLKADGPKNSCMLDFGEQKTVSTYLLNKTGEVSFNTSLILNNQRYLKIHDNLFSIGALIFKNSGIYYVALTHSDRQAYVAVYFEGFPYLGIWSPAPKAPFICIEPWYGIADNELSNHCIEDKEGIIKLAPANKFEACYTIEIF